MHAHWALSGRTALIWSLEGLQIKAVLPVRVHCMCVSVCIRLVARDAPIREYWCCNLLQTTWDPTDVKWVVQGKKDPEAKRKAIGSGFIDVFRDFAKTLKEKHGIKPKYLVQVGHPCLLWQALLLCSTMHAIVFEACLLPGGWDKPKHKHIITLHFTAMHCCTPHSMIRP